MSKRYVSKEVDCPFYRSEDGQKIYCEGVCDGNAIHLAFASPGLKKEYRKHFCCNEFGECRIADMLYTKWEEDGQ